MPAGIDSGLRAACDAQAGAVERWLAVLTDDDLGGSSALPGWRVAELAMHLAHGISVVHAALAAPRPPRGTTPLSAARYVSAFAAAAPDIAARERESVSGLDLAAIRARLRAERTALDEALDALGRTNPVVAASRGPIRVDTLLRTRVNELVTHSIDAARSLPDRSAPELAPAAVKVAVRFLAESLAERHPGRSIEVRVPPYVAVQIGAGPVHTRGTPPNVVETAPRAFIELATGRTSFAAALAAGAVRASGTRADLADYLPVLS